ncbi:ATP-binding protein, partial [Corynebacterium lehmanniae]
VFVEGHSITFELFGVPRHGGRLPFFPTQPGWISGVYLTGVRSTFLEDLHHTDVLVLDDFLTTPIDAATAHQLLNILAEREPRGSTIVTSQFTPDEWYKSIPDAVIAESILNRLVAGAEIITLEGTNMRLA